MIEKKILSVDLGIVNCAISFWTIQDNHFTIRDIFHLGLPNKQKNILDNIRQITPILQQFHSDIRDKLDNDTIILLEHQPQINRTSCMMHDIFATIFSQYQLVDIHPKKKNTIKIKLHDKICTIHDFNGYKPQKKFAIAICAYYLSHYSTTDIQDKFNMLKKKDDIADTISQCVYYLQQLNLC